MFLDKHTLRFLGASIVVKACRLVISENSASKDERVYRGAVRSVAHTGEAKRFNVELMGSELILFSRRLCSTCETTTFSRVGVEGSAQIDMSFRTLHHFLAADIRTSRVMRGYAVLHLSYYCFTHAFCSALRSSGQQ